MTSVSSTIEFDVVEWFDNFGTLTVDVYQKGCETPMFTHEIILREVVEDFIDATSGPDNLIVDGEDEDTAEGIIDELQDCIDKLNNALRDYDAI